MRYIKDVDYALEILEMLKPQTFQIESDFVVQACFYSNFLIWALYLHLFNAFLR